MDTHLALWMMHKNNTIFKSHHTVMHEYSKIKSCNNVVTKLMIRFVVRKNTSGRSCIHRYTEYSCPKYS